MHKREYILSTLLVTMALASSPLPAQIVGGGWIGISLQEITPELARQIGLGKPAGVLVAEVFAGSPAQLAGLLAGDVVMEADKQRIISGSGGQLPAIISQKFPGDIVQLTIWRRRQILGIAIRVGQMPEEERARRAGTFTSVPGGVPGTGTQSRPNVSQQTGGPQLVEQAKAAYENKNFEEALALYQEILRVAPPEYLARWEGALHRALGMCYTNLRRHKEAIAELTRANSIHEEADNFAWLGTVYNNLHEYSSAERYYKRAVELEPENADFYAGVAFASSRIGDYDEAQRTIDRGLEKAPNDEARRSLQESQIIIFLGKGMYAEASRVASQSKRISLDIEPDTLRIVFCYKGGPAQLAGLEPGDIVIALDGEPTPNTASLLSALNRATFGASVPIRVKRNGTELGKRVIIGIPSNLPELALAANGPSGNAAVGQASPAQTAPTIVIDRIEVKPGTVAPGDKFSVNIFYTLSAQATAGAKSKFNLSLSIPQGDENLYNYGPETFDSTKNPITRDIVAADDPGTYTIHVRVACGDVIAEREAKVTVVRK